MVELFSPQIERIIKLIQDQVDAAARKNANIDVSLAFQQTEFFANLRILATLPRRRFWRLAISCFAHQRLVCGEGDSVRINSSMVSSKF